MITYEHSGYNNNEFPAKDVIESIIYSIESYKEEYDYALENQHKTKAYEGITYSTYLTINCNDSSPMSLKQFCKWRKECNDFRLMLGSRYENFMLAWSVIE
jgi:hypothetical protein